ncbi:GNAT family N-acetyltransferase [Nonomuraea sp. NPDC050783]|uniref:GNAT family N-acetyltransferase n=1 Tax=Nonomuraea sp. NPDC050783 TaxID=3154634 RepID=UPI0034659EEA
MAAPDIRQAARADLRPLIRSLGQEHYFRDRLAKQDAGHGLLLVAWEREEAVGDVYVWLAPAEEPELRERLPGVALLTHLEVTATRRGQGIGTELLWAAEDRLLARGHERVALGVGLDNLGAQRLYRRRGYVEWPYGTVATTEVVYHPDGTSERRPEVCRVMVRRLGHNRYR